jgi:hypothetical protein
VRLFVVRASEARGKYLRRNETREPIIDYGCPVKSRTETVGWKELLTHFKNWLSEVPVKWGISRKE